MADEQDHAGLAMCPFCGSERITVWNIRDGQQAVCKDCHAAGAPAFNGGADSATVRARAAWNRRAQRQAAPVSRDGEDFEQLMENAFNEGWRSREPLGQLINSRATMRKAWLESNARDALLSAIQTGTGVEEEGDLSARSLPDRVEGDTPKPLSDGPSDLDRAWRAVDVLGAPDTACTTAEDRAYCRAIGDALAEIEKLGGRWN